ncbi:MAG: hypothetical protein ABIJ96_15075 [Elusimicrobiota bacterium]
MERSQNTMKEFDFRFRGLDPERDHGKVRRLRDCLLALAGGFTEIRPGALTDLLPGDGTGYIVALPDETSVRVLESALARLADEWGCKRPGLIAASKGPRSDRAFFLVPKLANRDESGYRRPLFSRERWAGIRKALGKRLSHEVALVYGEWLPKVSSRRLDRDASYMFIFDCCSDDVVSGVERFIKDEIFDGGRECDQEIIYLSVRGEGVFVCDPAGE